MNVFKGVFLVAATVGSLPFFVMAATDGSEGEATNRVLEEVIVTARRREEMIQSVPIPITALNEEQLATRNMTEIRDIERLSPNTSIDYSAVNGTAVQIFMRGIGQGNWSSTQDPKIGIYVDGVYLSRPQGGLLDFNDVQRVEVLRGPQGTLFGRNTTAGLLRIINNQPTQEFEANVKVGLGNDGQQNYGVVLNIPLSESLAARFSVTGKEADGIITNSYTGKDRGNEDSMSYRASLLWDVGDLEAQLTWDHFEADERAPLGSCRFTGPADPFGALALGGLPSLAVIFGVYGDMKENCENTSQQVSIDTTDNENATSDVDAYALTLIYDFGGVEVTSITAQRDIQNFNGTWGWVMGNGPTVNFLEILNNQSKHDIFSQELRLAGGTDNFDWIVGAYWFEEKSKESLDVPLFRGVAAPSPAQWPFFYTPTPAGGTLGAAAQGAQLYGSRNQAYDVVNKNKAFFAEATYSFNEKLDLTLGVRYTKDDRDFIRIQTLYGGAFDPAYFCPGMPTTEVAPGVFISASDRCNQDVSYSKTTPRAILSYQMSDDLMLYGSYSVGYSSGGFNQDVRMRPYLPEVSNNFEFGVKSDLMNGNLRVNATAFTNQYKNQQLTVGRIVNGQPTADLINAQEATLNGLELELIGQLTDTLSLSVTGGYIKGKYNNFTVDDNVTVTEDDGSISSVIVTRDLSDIEFGSGASVTGDISLLHILPLAKNGELVSSIGASFRDKTSYTLENTPSGYADSYWLIDARVTWFLSDEQTSIALWSANLANKSYVTTMLNQSGNVEIGGTDASLGMTADYWGAPRRFGLEVRHSF